MIKTCFLISSGQESSEENLLSLELNSSNHSSIGEFCDGHSITCEDVNAVCEKKAYKSLFYCKCREEFIYDRRYKKCIRIIAISQYCSNSRQCQASDRNSFCDYGQVLKNRIPICACRSNYFYSYTIQKCIKCRSSSNCPLYNRKLYHTSYLYSIGFLSKIFFTSLAFLVSLIFIFYLLTHLFHKLKWIYKKMRRKSTSSSDFSSDTFSLYHQARNRANQCYSKQTQSRCYHPDKPPSYEEAIKANYLVPKNVISVKTDGSFPKTLV